jgi:hypothetical protein
MDAPAPGLDHDTVAAGLTGGKFENLNTILTTFKGSDPVRPDRTALRGTVPMSGGDLDFDWVLVVDDDVLVPHGFVDRMIGVAEHFGLGLAQPAQSLASHAAWPVTRRRRGSLVRESRFVEIGPVTLFSREVLDHLAPFPPLRYGWGLDLHWAAVAEERGWKLGIVDALPVRHEQAGVAGTYSSEEAIAEAREFLTDRPFLESRAVLETVRTHRLG